MRSSFVSVIDISIFTLIAFSGSDVYEFKFFVENLNQIAIDLCYDTLTKQDLTKKAFANMRGILKPVFDLAYEKYWISDNPYKRINFKKFNDMTIRSTAASKRVHSHFDLERMLTYIHEYQTNNPVYMPAYALELQLLMGLRRGEIAPLEWTDIIDDSFIRISKEQITVRKTNPDDKERWVIVNHTKTYVDRDFPLTENIREFLTRLILIHQEHGLNSQFLFPDNRYEAGVINNSLVYHFYYTMCDCLNIPLSRESMKGPHSFRRNGITKVSNSPDGNLLMASVLYGNSIQSASKHYYTGVDLDKARTILEG